MVNFRQVMLDNSNNYFDEVKLDALKKQFPVDFTWGVATSAFQIEGAAKIDGKGDSIWDAFCRIKGTIEDGSNGDIACDHYHQLDRDLDLIAKLGVDAYRFSISWPRIQPSGEGAPNVDGLAFYERLIDGLWERNIKPYATLYHWDLPNALHVEQLGWENRGTAYKFCDYAEIIAKYFGDRIVSYATHNEPWVVAMLGYEIGRFAPGIKSKKIAMQVAHHLLLSHGLAVDAIRSHVKEADIGIVLNLSVIQPATDSAEDIALSKLDDGRILRWYMDALLKKSYPSDVLEQLGVDAPKIESNDLNIISNPIDFIGINYYTRHFSSSKGEWSAEEHGKPVTHMGWEIYPDGIFELLERLHTDYTLPTIYITENGAAFDDQSTNDFVEDDNRIKYIETHLECLAKAIKLGVNIKGYFVWSLFDNFEWSSGYTKRFGIIRVNYDTLERTPKKSALWFSRLIS